MAQSDILGCDLVRQNAMEKLEKDDDRVDQLVSAYRDSLSEPDEKKRTDACLTLWKFGPLAKATSDPAEQIRRTAAHALGNVGAARLDVVVPILMPKRQSRRSLARTHVQTTDAQVDHSLPSERSE